MKSKANPFSGSKILLWLPLACLVGFLVGSWGAHDELRSYMNSVKEGQKKASGKAAGFDTFVNMVKIPEMVRRPRRSKRPARKAVAVHATNTVSVAAAKKGSDGGATITNSPAGSAAENRSSRRFTPDDLRLRIEEAQELWRTRVDVVRAQWKDRLKLSGEAEAAFDAALQDMNDRLYNSVATVAELISDSETMSPELGLRLVGETTAIMAETYDRIGACVPQDMRADVSSMQIVDFVDPGVAEPLIGVQGKLEAFGQNAGRHR